MEQDYLNLSILKNCTQTEFLNIASIANLYLNKKLIINDIEYAFVYSSYFICEKSSNYQNRTEYYQPWGLLTSKIDLKILPLEDIINLFETKK